MCAEDHSGKQIPIFQSRFTITRNMVFLPCILESDKILYKVLQES